MAKIYLSRLIKKYGFGKDQVAGPNYKALITDVIQANNENTAKAVSRLTSDHWERANKRLRPGKQIVLPDVSEILPKRSVSLRKAANQGELITDTLRDKLNSDLRKVLRDFTTQTGEQAFIRRRGTKAGTVNPKVIALFQKKIAETMSGYTRKDPTFNVPSNVREIAKTEIRSTINDIKENHAAEIMRRNPGVKMQKTWIQNKSLSKEPRRGHSEVNGKSVAFKDKFMVPLYKKVAGGKLVRVGTTPMSRPHDPNAPAEQVIACSCDFRIFAVV